MIERTLVLLKPDAVQRCFVGEIISRFEKAGLKIVGMKMEWCNDAKSKAHYTEDIAIRRGEKVRTALLEFIQSGPIIAFVLEGAAAIENVRKIVGSTEPRASLPGTIRGDYAHVSYAQADATGKAVANLIHASADANDAKREIAVWFTEKDLHSYKTVHDIHVI